MTYPKKILLWSALLVLSLSAARAFADPPAYSIDSVSATAVSASEIDLSWSYPEASLVSPAITGYMIERESPVGGGFTTIVANTNSGATSYNDTNLSQNTVYNYRVSPVNSDGVGTGRTAFAVTEAAQVNEPPPDAPTLTASSPSASEIDLSWNAPNSESAITGYEVDRGNGVGFSVIVASTTATSYADTNLSPGANYIYRVIASNAFGASVPSNIVSVNTLTLPGPPISATAVAGNAQATLSWITPSFTGGITGYTITWANGSSTTVGTVTSTVITGLTNGTAYTFKVNSINPAGISAVTISNSVVPSAAPAPTPAPPRVISPTPTPSLTASPDNQALQSQLNSLMAELQALLAETNATGSVAVTNSSTAAVAVASSSATFSRNLYFGIKGTDVTALQNFLIAQNKGPVAAQLESVGATGYFGALTTKALAEFQASVGISPASGYFGPKTRAYISLQSSQ